MTPQQRILIVIPARGPSKGIPRKNLRSMNGHPLIYYAIRTALASLFSPRVVVSSEDSEILSLAEKFGAIPCKRRPGLSEDATVLDPVICSAYEDVCRETGGDFDYVVTMQPTSPLLRTESLDAALEKMIASQADTIIAARDDRGLTWTRVEGRYVPLYDARVNRQYLPPVYRETGGFLISSVSVIRTGKRIGDAADLFVLSDGEEIDIDTYEDWAICEFLMKRRRIVFRVIGNSLQGLGHVYRALQIANDLVSHEIVFVTDAANALAYEAISSKCYQVVSTEDPLAAIRDLSPHLVINDMLDTDSHYIGALRAMGCRVLNFEDRGSGALHADAVINELYDEAAGAGECAPNIYTGPDYFYPRDEFRYTRRRPFSETVGNILLTFGGADPSNLTRRVLSEISDLCAEQDIRLTVLLGAGYTAHDSLTPFVSDNGNGHIEFARHTFDISSYIRSADLVISAKGRTVFEIAAVGTPAIVIPQNEREEKDHTFARMEYGFLVMSRKDSETPGTISDTVGRVVADTGLRMRMRQSMLKWDFADNRRKILSIVQGLL